MAAASDEAEISTSTASRLTNSFYFICYIKETFLKDIGLHF